MVPRATRGQLLAGLLCAVLGFALVVQLQAADSPTVASLRQSELIGVLNSVTQRSAQADEQARKLEQQEAALRSGSDSTAAAQDVARQRLETLQILAGTIPAQGQGIVLEISDPQGRVPASTLLDAVQELRDAGAEAMQIGRQRVVADTWFADDASGRGIQISNQLEKPPYTIKVIGDKTALATALRIPGGVMEVLKSQGATGVIDSPATVVIDALRPAPTPQYARPSSPATP
jgi:uncharacterized protein YlxW (UPF0749 family)